MYSYNPIYQSLGTRSRRYIHKIKKKGGHWNKYRPRMSLLARLATEHNISEDNVRKILQQIRFEILKEKKVDHILQLNPFI